MIHLDESALVERASRDVAAELRGEK